MNGELEAANLAAANLAWAIGVPTLAFIAIASVIRHYTEKRRRRERTGLNEALRRADREFRDSEFYRGIR